MAEESNNLHAFFSALGNPSRMKIIHLLLNSEKPLHLKGIARLLHSDYAVTYRHVEKLKEAGIVGIYDVGRSRVPYLRNKEELRKVIEAASKCMSKPT
ncbi:MAG: winged helix-turn-helix domain-containing protein [Conexivisphaerales archaeon]